MLLFGAAATTTATAAPFRTDRRWLQPSLSGLRTSLIVQILLLRTEKEVMSVSQSSYVLLPERATSRLPNEK